MIINTELNTETNEFKVLSSGSEQFTLTHDSDENVQTKLVRDEKGDRIEFSISNQERGNITVSFPIK